MLCLIHNVGKKNHLVTCYLDPKEWSDHWGCWVFNDRQARNRQISSLILSGILVVVNFITKSTFRTCGGIMAVFCIYNQGRLYFKNNQSNVNDALFICTLLLLHPLHTLLFHKCWCLDSHCCGFLTNCPDTLIKQTYSMHLELYTLIVHHIDHALMYSNDNIDKSDCVFCLI